MHRQLEWDRVESDQQRAKDRVSEAQEAYRVALLELKPGEVSPGISEVMLRVGKKRAYRKMKIKTPYRLTDWAVVFTNGKTARVLGKIQTSEDTTKPFLWITVESKNAR
jgi:hypothetical protein